MTGFASLARPVSVPAFILLAIAPASALRASPERDPGPAYAEIEVAAWRAAATGTTGVLRGVRLDQERVVDLVVERFSVTTSRTRFVRGPAGTPFAFDPTRVVLLRGNVVGHPGSHAVFALSDHGHTGFVQLAAGGGLFGVSSRDRGGDPLPPDRLSVFPAVSGGGVALPVPLCGTRTHDWRPPPARAGDGPVRGLTQIELAIETDYEYFELFGDADAAASYVVALYGIVSDLFRRDLRATVDLTFVRLWDDPDDLFNGDSPLVELRDYWNENMDEVQRDVVQLLSGRRDLDYGGSAYLGALCGERGYSVSGYTVGRFADPDRPDVFNRDIIVTAHELGHNSGTPHTHDLGVDTCDDEDTIPQRGTVMSYCGQTFTGGSANMDLRFHAVVQRVVDDYLESASCVVDDCNGNGRADVLDIFEGTSEDANGNRIPDECEDCNDNGTLDDRDIDEGTSDDANGNGVPDECEPDCDDNGRPDDLDIELGAADANGNNVPDACEADCNGNGTPDYDEIQADMALDLNRNAILDACEDCDGDGTTDLATLDGAFDVWITSLDQTTARSYLSRTGTLTDVSDEGIRRGQDLLVDAGRGRILVTSELDDRVVAFGLDGSTREDLVGSGVGGLNAPAGIVLTVTGDVLVASRGTDEVLAYGGDDGAFLGAFVSAGAGGLRGPFGLTFGPDGDLYVTSEDGRVLVYDGTDGTFRREFVTAADNGGLLEPRGLLFVPATGKLLVASWGTNQVLEYDGSSGAFVRQFNRGGTSTRLTLDQPWGLRLGPEGDVYVSRSNELETHDHGGGALDLLGWFLHLTNARIYHFEAESGRFERTYILGVNSGIDHPTGFDFVPGAEIDCNVNLVPDRCDIERGTSSDLNRNGVPDECEPCVADLDGSGAVDFGDILVILATWGDPGGEADLDGSGVVDFGDILVVLGTWGECVR